MIHILIGMNVQIDGFGQIQREDTHDGLSVDNVTAGNQIEIGIELSQIIDEGFYFINRVKRYLNGCHN